MFGRVSTLVSGRRSRWLVIGAWLVVAAALAPFQPRLLDRAADESDTFLVRGSESARVATLLDERFDVGRETVTTLVYVLPEATESVLAGPDRLIEADAEAICEAGEIPDLLAVFPATGGPTCDHRDLSLDTGPETPPSSISENQRVAITFVLTGDDATPAVVRDVEALREIAGGERGDGIRVHVSGPGGVDADRAEAVAGIDETLLVITAVLILLILLAVYRSPLVAAVPLGVAAIAYLVAAGVTWGLVAAGATTISGQTTAILIVLMFGAGTDYCLLILARFRDRLRAGEPVEDAMASAAERTGPAILSAGAIVAGVMALLALADFNATREMGPILALGMVIMVLAGLTLLPAVLAAVGRTVFWPRSGAERRGPTGRASAEPDERGVWARVARVVERRPRPIAIAVTALLALGALGNLGGRETLAFTDAFRDDPDSVAGAQAVSEHFASGRVAPLELLVSEPVASEVARPLVEDPRLGEVIWSGASLPSGDDEAVALGAGDPERLIKIDLVLDADPFSARALDLVPELRDDLGRGLAQASAAVPRGTETVALLGGPTAEAHDAERAIARDTRLIVPLALALVFVVLVALLRSLVAPLYVLATVVLSFLFALGVGSLFFTHVMGQPGSDPSLAVFAFIFLVGLGVDYNVFLVGRIREELRSGLDSRRAALAGLARTGGVITSAGLILAGTFSALMALEFEALFQFGFVIALGLLVDTFLVRALLVPAIAVELGERSWWPWGGGTARRSANEDSGLQA